MEPWSTRNLLSPAQVDPDPVYLEGGGLRLYHTCGHLGSPGYAETLDGLAFGEDIPLIETDGNCLEEDVGVCESLLDPSFLRLEDDSMWLYFTWLAHHEDDTWETAIVRARVLD
jgi:hypothetical protein